MFSQTVEYALRSIVYLAGQKAACTTVQIAAATKVPPAYLAKVLQNLSRVELVRSQRGLHGGFALGRNAWELTVWEVIQAVEPMRRIHECPLELEGHRTQLCPLHKKIDDVIASTERAFRETTIADIVGEPASNQFVCPFPYTEVEEKVGRVPLA